MSPRFKRFWWVLFFLLAMTSGCRTPKGTAPSRRPSQKRRVVRRVPVASKDTRHAIEVVERFIAAVRDGEVAAIRRAMDLHAIAAAQRPPGIAPSKQKTAEVVQEVLSMLMDPGFEPAAEISASRVIGAQRVKHGVRVTVDNGKVRGHVLVAHTRKGGWRIVRINP